MGEGATVNANRIHRVFQVRNDSENSSSDAAILTIENITVTGGEARNDIGEDRFIGSGVGGGIVLTHSHR